MDEVAERAAAVGAQRRLGEGIVAEPVNELGCVGQRFPAGEMDVMAQRFPPFLPAAPFSAARFQTFQSARLTPDKGVRLCHGRSMRAGKYSQAGGFLLAASILGGSVAGAALHQASIGFLAGLGVGVALAVAIWIRDRTRQRP